MPTTVILGGGIIGLSTAYYLSLFTAETTPKTESVPSKHEIHLVEASPEFFASASGKAAGFLAKDWFAPAVAPLGAFSFNLHRKLAEEFGGRERWGWSESESYSLDRDNDSEGEGYGALSDALEQVSEAEAAAAKEDATGGSRTRPTDIEWLMSGSSRATLLGEQAVESAGSFDSFPTWVCARRPSLQSISDRTTTGQVDPRRLCAFLLQESKARGVIIHQPARATALLPTPSPTPPSVSSSPTSIRIQHLAPTDGLGLDVELDSRRSPSPSYYEDAAHFGTPTETVDLAVDNIIVAAGCWTPSVYRTLFPNASRIPGISALAGHSITMKSKHWTPTVPPKEQASQGCSPIPTSPSSHAVFTSDPAGYSPEIFSRVGGDVWLGGLNSSSIPLPPLPHLAKPDIEAIKTLTETGKALCGSDVEVISEGLCFRPVAPTGRPVVGRIHGADLGDGEGANSLGNGGNRQESEQSRGVYVATGHGPWGISLSLGTGHVLSEMVLGRQPSIDVGALALWEAQAS